VALARRQHGPHRHVRAAMVERAPDAPFGCCAMRRRRSASVPYRSGRAAIGQRPLQTRRGPSRGSRRYQGKIFGKEDSDDITVGRQTRVYLKKQYVVLYVTTRTERDVTVLDSKIGSVIPVYRLL
jgi:hypothetical protein